MKMLLIKSIFANAKKAPDALTDAAKKASEGIHSTGTNALPYILLIVIVLGGLALILLGRRGKEGVKEQAPQVLVGIAMIVMAVPIAAWLMGIF